MSTEERLLIRDGQRLEEVGGFETEYAAQLLLDKNRNDNPELAAIRAQVRSSGVGKVALSSEIGTWNDKGMFPDGSRRYQDVGQHPEFSTAEDIDFLDSTVRLLHGHIEMAGMIRDAAKLIAAELGVEAPPDQFISLTANTTDGKGNSWASHESLTTPRATPWSLIQPALIAHNASRIVWAGAGYVVRRGDGSYRYQLSEKAPFIKEVCGNATTRERPLVNNRDEPLSDHKLQRIHTISGETVFSPTVNALRLASTAIILRACELGVEFKDLRPTDPVQALRQISADSNLRTKILLENGRTMTGLELQEALLDRAYEAGMKAGYLTDQEQYWAATWSDVLQLLKTDPTEAMRLVDWVLKREIVEKTIAKKASHPGQAKSTPAERAWATAVCYHSLLPAEGYGMLAVRKGFFALSPSAEILEQGLPLPRTRAAARAKAVARFNKLGRSAEEVSVDWHRIEDKKSGKIFTLLDPWQTAYPELDAYLDSLPESA